MPSPRQLFETISGLYGGDSPEVACCRALFDFLTSQKDSQLKHLTFRRLLQVSKADPLVLIRVLALFAGPKYAYLTTHYEFLDDDGDYLDATESVLNIDINGGFIHPRTGALVVSYKSQVFVYYAAVEKVGELLKGGL